MYTASGELMKGRLLIAALILASSLGPAPHAAQFRPRGETRIVLLVDSSASMAPMLTSFREGMVFLDALPPEPEIAIVSIGSQLRVRVTPTADRAKLHAAANSSASDGGDNELVASLVEADKRFLKIAPERRSVIVILTSDLGGTVGNPPLDADNRFLNDFVGRGGLAHAIVVVGTTSGITTEVAHNLANNTRGFFNPLSVTTGVPAATKTLAAYVAAGL